MALEQWEIDLRNQLGNFQLNTPVVDVQKEEVITSEKTSSDDWLFYTIVFLFFLLSGLAILDLKTDFIGKLMSSKKTIDIKQEVDQEKELVSEDSIGADKALELSDKIRKTEEKLFVLGVITNENAAILKNGMNRKDILTITKDWKVVKTPKYISMSDKDKEYFDKIQGK